MSKCPKCKEEIDYLVNWCSALQSFYFDGEEYEERDSIGTGEVSDYECPLCSEVLFTDEDNARKFLRGETMEGEK